jgi:MinD-like ATPase involved in chromosome partitioning or flagellar assembly
MVLASQDGDAVEERHLDAEEVAPWRRQRTPGAASGVSAPTAIAVQGGNGRYARAGGDLALRHAGGGRSLVGARAATPVDDLAAAGPESSDADRRARPRPTGWSARLGVAIARALTSRGEREEGELDARLGCPGPATRLNVVAVLSPKRGVGKTTTSWLISNALAATGGVSVCAIDANPEARTLGELVPPGRLSARTLSDLFEDYGDREPPSAAALGRYVSALPSGLGVLAAPPDPEVMGRMGEPEYKRLLALVEGLFTVVVLDCGTGLGSGLAEWAMRRADHLLLVSTPDSVSIHGAARALDGVPAERCDLVVNQVRKGGRADLAGLVDNGAWWAPERVHALPYDEALHAMLDSAAYELGGLRRPVRVAIKRLAAHVGEVLR